MAIWAMPLTFWEALRQKAHLHGSCPLLYSSLDPTVFPPTVDPTRTHIHTHIHGYRQGVALVMPFTPQDNSLILQGLENATLPDTQQRPQANDYAMDTEFSFEKLLELPRDDNEFGALAESSGILPEITLVPPPVQQSPSQSALHDFYNDKFLDEPSWNFTGDNMSAIFNDSTTLPSARTSMEYRTSSEVFDTLSQFEDDVPTNTTSRFRSSISNSISSIFKSNNPNSRFNLRGMNPLSAHKDVQLVVQALPMLSNSVEDLSISKNNDEEQPQTQLPKKQKHKVQCDLVNNLHLKGCGCNGRSKSRAQSLVNALSSARLGFNSKTAQVPSMPQTIEEEKLNFEFDEELTKVISMASLTSSSYNFNQNNNQNNNNNNHDQTLSSIAPLLTDSSSTPMDADELSHPIEEIDKKHSPDYAALFSDVKSTKKRSMFRGPFTKSAATAQLELKQHLETLPEVSQASSLTSGSREATDVLSLDDLVPSEQKQRAQLIQNEAPRRGRKPTLEFDPAKQFVCSYCMRRFKRQEHLKRHVRSLHTHEKPFDCTICDKKFSRSDNLAQHIKTHTADEEMVDDA